MVLADIVVADIDFLCGRYGFLLWPISYCCGRYGCGRYGLWPIWSHPLSCDCHLVPNVLLYAKFHKNRMIFRWDMAISRFSRWRMSAALNFRDPVMGSLKSPCRTSYWSSIETIALDCLVFETRLYAFGRQRDERWASGGLIVRPTRGISQRKSAVN